MRDYNEIFSEIAQYRMLKAQAEAELKELENEIKAYLLEEGMTELIGTEHTAKYTEVTSNRLDTAALKAAMPDVVKAYTKPSKSMRFTFN